MNIILLSGGSGKRLWPLSNDVRSKQFIKLFKNEKGEYESMVQRVYRQITKVDPEAKVTIATSKSQASAIKNQLGENVSICVEPCRRDEKDVYSVLENIKFDVVVECLAYDIKQLEISLRNFSSRCSQYVFVSTAGVYNRIGNQRIKESDLKNFTEWSYTKNKIECEKFLKEYSMKTGLR